MDKRKQWIIYKDRASISNDSWTRFDGQLTTIGRLTGEL